MNEDRKAWVKSVQDEAPELAKALGEFRMMFGAHVVRMDHEKESLQWLDPNTKDGNLVSVIAHPSIITKTEKSRTKPQSKR